MSPFKTFPSDQVLPVNQSIEGSGEGGLYCIENGQSTKQTAMDETYITCS